MLTNNNLHKDLTKRKIYTALLRGQYHKRLPSIAWVDFETAAILHVRIFSVYKPPAAIHSCLHVMFLLLFKQCSYLLFSADTDERMFSILWYASVRIIYNSPL